MTAETDALTLQVQQRVRRHRNARMLRGIGITLVISVVMIMLAISNRDQQAYKSTRKKMQELATLLKEQPGARIRLPSTKWVFNPRYTEEAGERGQAGVCARRVDMFLWSDGWHVLMLTDDEYVVTWLDADQFEQDRATLGLKMQE